MYTLTSSACFDSAHFLKGYKGKCSNIHGHRWTIEATVGSDELSEDKQTRGMVVDFRELKDALKAEADNLDHCLIIEEGSLKDKTLEAMKEEGFAEDVLDDVMDLSHPKTSELFRYGCCISPLINGEISAEEFISFAENEISSLWEEFVAESSLGLAAEQCQKRIVLFFDTKQGFLWQFSSYGNPLGFPLSVPSEAQANAFILWLKLQTFPILMRWEYA